MNEDFDNEGVEAGDHSRFVGSKVAGVDSTENQDRQHQSPEAFAQGGKHFLQARLWHGYGVPASAEEVRVKRHEEHDQETGDKTG